VYDREGVLLYQYMYEGLKFNVGLGDRDFDVELNGF